MNMKILNLLESGGVGGIEQLCKNIGIYANYSNTFCFLFEEGQIYEEMIDKGLDAVSLVDKSGGKFSISRWKKLCDLAKDFDIITIHHCTISLQIYYILLNKKFPNKKFVMTVHSCFEENLNFNYDNRFKNIVAKWSLDSSLMLSDKIVFVSEAGRKSYLENFDIKINKTEVVYNGVVTQKIINDQYNKNYFRLTYIGRLEKIKGIALLLHAFKKLIEKDKSIKLRIIGDGSDKNNLIKLSKKLELNNYVEFLGIQRDIGFYLEQTDGFIYPSICQEVFGISIVEAMSYGVPCISNNVGGIPEIIKDGVNGFITEEISAYGIYESINRMTKTYNTPKWEDLKKESVNTSKMFSISNTVNSLKSMYEGLLYD